MDEVFRQVRQIVVDYVRDVIHVQSAGGYVGGYQNLEAALLKSCQRSVALRLRPIAVNHGDGETVAHQFLGQPLGAALGAREHQGLPLLGIQQLT